jgi:hypothetical protein
MTPILVALGAILSLIAPTTALTIDDNVTVTVEEASDHTLLGDTLDLAITVTNSGPATTESLVLHIDITDLGGDGSVDPEDWTATLSKPVGQLGPGESRRVDWRLQPISGGSFTLYAVALAAGVDNLASSNVVTIDVTDQRSLNPNGILPAAIGTPTVVGALLVVQVRRSRRRQVEPITAT